MLLTLMVFALELDLAKIVPQAMAAAETHKQEALAKPGRCLVAKPCDGSRGVPRSDLVVFVSASMPKNALKGLAQDAKTTGARLVIKGFVNGSFQETAALVKELGLALDIDPELFARLNITQVPVFAVPQGDDWHVLKGNVTLPYAQGRLKE